MTIWSGRTWTAAVLILLGLCAAVYGPTLGHEFVWDDHEQVVNNQALRQWSSLPDLWRLDVLSSSRGQGLRSNYYRPLFFTQLVAYYQLFGAEPMGWHALAILHHTLACLAVLLFLWRLGVTFPAALATATLFAVHPAHGESVSWVAAAFNDPPAATLILLALTAHVHGLRNRNTWTFLAAGLAFAGALLLKESSLAYLALAPLTGWLAVPEINSRTHLAATLPGWFILTAYVAGDLTGGPVANHANAAIAVVLLLITTVWVTVHRSRWKLSAPTGRLVTAGLYSAVVAALYLYLRKVLILTMLGNYSGGPSFLDTLPSMPSILLFYLRLLAWPFGLGPSYPLRMTASWASPAAWGSALVLAVITVAVAALARRHRPVFFATTWILVCVAPALNIRSFRPTYLVHQRYLYLACFGLCLAVVWLLARLDLSRRWKSAIFALLLTIWAASTVYHHRFWSNDQALWTRVSDLDPGNPAAFDWLGTQAMNEGRLDEAETLFRRSLAADRGSPLAWCNLATLTHLSRARPGEALPLYVEAIERFSMGGPEHAAPEAACRINYGLALAQSGRAGEALAIFVKVAEGPHGSVLADRNAAVLLRQSKQWQKLTSWLDEALLRHPDDPTLNSMASERQKIESRHPGT